MPTPVLVGEKQKTDAEGLLSESLAAEVVKLLGVANKFPSVSFEDGNASCLSLREIGNTLLQTLDRG